MFSRNIKAYEQTNNTVSKLAVIFKIGGLAARLGQITFLLSLRPNLTNIMNLSPHYFIVKQGPLSRPHIFGR